MSSPEKPSSIRKKKKTVTPEKPTPEPETTTIFSLPEDLLLNCLARVSRLHYPNLSLVSKRFPPLLASPELYKYRSRLNRTENCLYLLLRDTSTNKNRWYTLCCKKNTQEILIPVADSDSESPPRRGAKLISSGSAIYSISGLTRVSVSMLDCKSNTWREAPRMRFDRIITCASELDGKIYVVEGGYCNPLIEMFDTKTQIWNTLPVPGGYGIWSMVCFEGKLHLLSKEQSNLVYDPKRNEWSLFEGKIDQSWRFIRNYVVIDNVCYSCGNRKLVWLDTKSRSWKTVKGLDESSYYCPGSTMVDYGGKMAVLWQESVKNIICFVVIAFKRRDGDEIWGKVESVKKFSGHLLEAFVVTL